MKKGYIIVKFKINYNLSKFRNNLKENYFCDLILSYLKYYIIKYIRFYIYN